MDRFRARLPQAELCFFSYWDLLPDALPLTVLESRTAPGHAQEFETSALHYIAPHMEDEPFGIFPGATSRLDTAPAPLIGWPRKLFRVLLSTCFASHSLHNGLADGPRRWDVGTEAALYPA